MTQESYFGATRSIAGKACVGSSGGSGTGCHGCVSPEFSLLSSGSPVLLQPLSSFMKALSP